LPQSSTNPQKQSKTFYLLSFVYIKAMSIEQIENDELVKVVEPPPPPVVKPKRVVSQATLDALARGREKQKANRDAKKAEKEQSIELPLDVVPSHKKKKPAPTTPATIQAAPKAPKAKRIVEVMQSSSEEESSDEEILYVKTKPKQRIVYHEEPPQQPQPIQATQPPRLKRC
jgi:hypothetical protein